MQLTTSGFCMHRSWGFGRIKTVDTVFARFTIDFPNKPGHTMDLAFAAESLKPISKDHILARKASDLEGLRQMAATNHLELVKAGPQQLRRQSHAWTKSSRCSCRMSSAMIGRNGGKRPSAN